MSGKRALTANHRHDTGCLDEGRSAEPPFPTSSLPRRSRPASLLFSRLKSARHAMQKARRMAWPRAIPWWSVRDLNPRPCACKAPALPLRQPTLRARRPCVPDGPPPKCPFGVACGGHPFSHRTPRRAMRVFNVEEQSFPQAARRGWNGPKAVGARLSARFPHAFAFAGGSALPTGRIRFAYRADSRRWRACSRMSVLAVEAAALVPADKLAPAHAKTSDAAGTLPLFSLCPRGDLWAWAGADDRREKNRLRRVENVSASCWDRARCLPRFCKVSAGFVLGSCRLFVGNEGVFGRMPAWSVSLF